jgi:hypothetical protein
VAEVEEPLVLEQMVFQQLVEMVEQVQQVQLTQLLQQELVEEVAQVVVLEEQQLQVVEMVLLDKVWLDALELPILVVAVEDQEFTLDLVKLVELAVAES